MEEILGFRGLAGEVLRSLLRPTLWLTAFPVLVLWGLLWGALYALGSKVPLFFHPGFVLCTFGSIVSRFALASARGDVHAGFFARLDRENRCVSPDDTCLKRALGFPLFLISQKNFHYYLSKSFLGDSDFLSAASLIKNLGSLGALFAIFYFAPDGLCLYWPHSYVLARRIWRRFLAPSPTLDCFVHRRADTLVFLANITGGISLFLFYYFVPAVLLALLASKIHTSWASHVLQFIFLYPFLILPILVGRLCGAFVAGERRWSTNFVAMLESSKASRWLILSSPLKSLKNIKLKNTFFHTRLKSASKKRSKILKI